MWKWQVKAKNCHFFGEHKLRGSKFFESIHTLDLFNLSKYKGIFEEFYSLLKTKSKPPKVFENASIHCEDNLVVYKFH